MSTARALYARWITDLWLSEGELVAGRWVGAGHGPDGPVSFTGNDILRLAADGRRFAEYWTGTSAG